MSEKVYFIEAADNEQDEILCGRLKMLVEAENLLDCIADKDITAVKTHFGESQKLGYVRPLYLKMLGEGVKNRGGIPFLTETSTLYKGNRSNAIAHIAHAHSQGFDYASTGMPIIMADGLFGDEEETVPIQGKGYTSVHIAALFAKCNALVMVSHFTGHLAAGFGATLKNLGMGCASRKGKMEQHSTAKPKIIKKKCTACGTCVKWCPREAILLQDDEAAKIDSLRCIGCGECLAMCRFDAVKFDWGATYEELQKKVVEHAMGTCSLFRGKSLFINVLTRISKDCDCMGHTFKKITPDIGILVSRDPVALDAASLDLVEKRAGKTLAQLAHDIPYRFQLDYAGELQFGSQDYELVRA
ncbi:MAG: 4Fe-4S ferredoxin, iron-sulfur binding protein [uncultured bacterium]|nr:MAG: 4Fe-4S ferredoxin, iron-sulfur binding protein [uncultured bacterium]